MTVFLNSVGPILAYHLFAAANHNFRLVCLCRFASCPFSFRFGTPSTPSTCPSPVPSNNTSCSVWPRRYFAGGRLESVAQAARKGPRTIIHGVDLSCSLSLPPLVNVASAIPNTPGEVPILSSADTCVYCITPLSSHREDIIPRLGAQDQGNVSEGLTRWTHRFPSY